MLVDNVRAYCVLMILGYPEGNLSSCVIKDKILLLYKINVCHR